jgi:hypothetical protein
MDLIGMHTDTAQRASIEARERTSALPLTLVGYRFGSYRPPHPANMFGSALRICALVRCGSVR